MHADTHGDFFCRRTQSLLYVLVLLHVKSVITTRDSGNHHHPRQRQTVLACLQVFEKLSDTAVLASLPAEQQFICPYPSCSAISLLGTRTDYKSVKQSCPYCKRPVCVYHKCVWHEGVTCDNYEGAPDDIAVLMLARQEGLARCPGCKIVTQRIAVSLCLLACFDPKWAAQVVETVQPSAAAATGL